MLITLDNGVRRTEFSSDDIGGYMKFNSNLGTQAIFEFDNTGNFGQVMISDERMKDNIHNMSGVLPRILQLAPSYFNFKYADPDQVTYGLLAQNVREVFPELVHEMKGTEYLGVDYSRFSVLAIQAIKEQQETIDELRENQRVLEDRVQKLEELLHKLN